MISYLFIILLVVVVAASDLSSLFLNSETEKILYFQESENTVEEKEQKSVVKEKIPTEPATSMVEDTVPFDNEEQFVMPEGQDSDFVDDFENGLTEEAMQDILNLVGDIN